MLKPIVAGNWKMNKTPQEGKSFIDDVVDSLRPHSLKLPSNISHIPMKHYAYPKYQMIRS